MLSFGHRFGHVCKGSLENLLGDSQGFIPEIIAPVRIGRVIGALDFGLNNPAEIQRGVAFQFHVTCH